MEKNQNTREIAHSDQMPEERILLDEGIPFSQRIACTISDAKTASGLGATIIYELIKDGTLESVKVGRRRLIVVRSLRRLLEGEKAERGAG